MDKISAIHFEIAFMMMNTKDRSRVWTTCLQCILVSNLLLFVCGCGNDSKSDPDDGDKAPNILLIIADDLGKDALNGFTEGELKPRTPNLDAIREAGITFNNMWVYPTCSPTRASIITGKYGYRTGVKWAEDRLGQSEEILQQYIKDHADDDYATALIGKWHLSGSNTSFNPENLGIDHYEGLIRGEAQSYYQWQLTSDGSESLQTDYITKSFTDRAINWVNAQDKPWFLWLAYNAPHTPFHVPPDGIHEQGDLPAYTNGADATPYYFAAIEAMDFQIGRLFDEIPAEEVDNTVIIFLGDNGTPQQVAQWPYGIGSAKGSLKQGGINVPMFISGNGVMRSGSDDNLITSTDLFTTIAEIAGIESGDVHDSKSFKALLDSPGTHRTFQYSEKDNDTDDLWTISNGAYKLIVHADGSEEMYNLKDDPYEKEDLLPSGLSSEAVEAKADLEAELLNIRK